jgi:hypothetical protein
MVRTSDRIPVTLGKKADVQQLDWYVHTDVTDEILFQRMRAFNEKRGYYALTNTSREPYDAASIFPSFYVNRQLVASNRLTPSPFNHMQVGLRSEAEIPHDNRTIEMGRSFVVPEHRESKLLTLLLLKGLRLCDEMGYRHVVGNVGVREHVLMPQAVGFTYNGLIADFAMPTSRQKVFKWHVLVCDLIATRDLRAAKTAEMTKRLADSGYELTS